MYPFRKDNYNNAVDTKYGNEFNLSKTFQNKTAKVEKANKNTVK